MARFLAISLLAISILPAWCWADMYLMGVGDDHARSFRHDRFYAGADKAFFAAGYDFSGVGQSTSWGRWATLISPSYYVSATHSHPNDGETINFYLGNSYASPYYSATVEGGVAVAGSDLWLGKLTQPVPASAGVAIYPIYVPGTTSADYIGKTCFLYGCPNRVGLCTVRWSVFGGIYYGFYDNASLALGEDDAYLQGGDSGGPSFGSYGNQLAVVGTHSSINGSDSIDTFTPLYLNDLLTAMNGEYFRVGPANNWQGPAGAAADWATNGNWVCGTPVLQADVVIANGGTAVYSTPTSQRLNSLAVASGGAGNFQMSDGALTITDSATVGSSGSGDQGTATFSGGTQSIPTLTLGAGAASNGTVTLSGAAQLTTTSLVVGSGGTGTFTQTGGTHTAGAVMVGQSAGAVGSYAQSAGGTTADTVTLGASAGANGSYSLSGAATLTAGAVVVGAGGVGTFTQTGGTHTAGPVTLGSLAGGSGTYNLGGTGQLSASSLCVGDSGSGSVVQSGGSCTVSGDLTLGKTAAASSGAYHISGGSLSTNNLYVGKTGSGTLAIDGSSADVTVGGNLSFGAGSIYTAVSGSTIKLTGGSVQNTCSTPSQLAGLANTTLTFSSPSPMTQTMEASGLDQGAHHAGFDNNYMLGSLRVGTATAVGTVQLVDNYDNQHNGANNEALYVDSVVVAAGSTLNLNGRKLYYHSISNAGTIAGSTAARVSQATLHLWLTAGPTGLGDYDVQVWAQVLGGLANEGVASVTFTISSPGTRGVTAPQEDPDSPGSVLWACNLSGTPIFLAPTLGDADSDGDMDALSATVGLSNSKNLTLGMTPVLLATETWQMLSSSPADLQISVNDSQQWDSMATKGTKIAFDNFQMTGLHVAPEPASAAILLVGAVSLLRRRF